MAQVHTFQSLVPLQKCGMGEILLKGPQRPEGKIRAENIRPPV